MKELKSATILLLSLIPVYCLELDAEERALTDGRIGPETVGIDRASLCGSMNINDGIEVHVLQEKYFFQ